MLEGEEEEYKRMAKMKARDAQGQTQEARLMMGKKGACFQAAKRGALRRERKRAATTGRWIERARHGLKVEAQKGKDRYTQLCNEQL